MGELGSLKDRLNTIRKEAKQFVRSLQQHEGIVPLAEAGVGDRSTRSYNIENVFFDNPEPEEQRTSSRGGRDMNRSRINTACNNADGRPVMACGQDTGNGSSPARLAAPQVPQFNDVPVQRSMEIDLSQSLTEIIANVHGVEKDPQLGINLISNHTDAWMYAMRSRQANYEEQLKRMQNNLVTLSITLQGAESFYEDLQGDIKALKSNSSEVWQRLRTDEIRMDNLDRSISSIEDRVKENLETVNEWFADLTARPNQSEIPGRS